MNLLGITGRKLKRSNVNFFRCLRWESRASRIEELVSWFYWDGTEMELVHVTDKNEL